MIIKAGSHKLEKREAIKNNIEKPVLCKSKSSEREIEKIIYSLC